MYLITKEQYYQNLKIRYPNDNFTVLEPFTGAKNAVTLKCNTCGQIFNYKRGTTLYSNRRTSLCKLCNTKSVQNFYKICKEQNITIVENKYNVTDPWKLYCNKCKTTFYCAPSKWLQQSCPNCGFNHNAISIEERQKEVDEKFGKNEFTVLNSLTRNFIVRHKCGFIRKTQYHAFINSKDCPRCSKTMSKGESAIMNYLDKNNIFYKYQEKMGNTQQTFDFYFPQLNAVIEYNGQQHYFPVETFGGEERFKQQIQYDKNKEEYCKNNNIVLEVIPYTEFNNLNAILNKFFKKFNDQSKDVKKD